MRRQGVTLIEMVLIMAVLILLIGGMWLPSMTGGDVAGDAARIASDMESIKNAATAWYVDNRQMMKNMYAGRITRWNPQSNKTVLAEIAKYVDSSGNLKLNDGGNSKLAAGGYGICNVGSHRTTWYVGYKFLNDEPEVKNKLKGRAKLLGLHFSDEWPNPDGIDPDKNVKSGDRTVWMHILGDHEDTSSWWK